MDRYVDLDPGDGEVSTRELFVTEDLLVKAFALGPGAVLEAHEHPDQTNVFHVTEGELVVVSADEEATVTAPATVGHERGRPHGARNESGAPAVFTATMGPMG